VSTPHATEAHRYANRWAAVASFGAFVVLALFSNIYYPVQRLAIFARPAPADGSIVSGVDDQGAAVFLADVDRFCCRDLTRDAWDAACGHGLANEIFDPMQWQEVQSRAGDCADGRPLRLVRYVNVLSPDGVDTQRCPIATCRAVW
jgi:hypothetical protein